MSEFEEFVGVRETWVVDRDGVAVDGVELVDCAVQAEIAMYACEGDYLAGKPSEIIEWGIPTLSEGQLQNFGGNKISDLLRNHSLGGTSFNNANTRLIISNSTSLDAQIATTVAGETGRAAMATSFPINFSDAPSNTYTKADGTTGTVTTRQSAYRALFASGVATGAWEKVGIVNAAAAGDVLDIFLIPAALTKGAGAFAQLTVTVTWG